jgi:hypothetical protein
MILSQKLLFEQRINIRGKNAAFSNVVALKKLNELQTTQRGVNNDVKNLKVV